MSFASGRPTLMVHFQGPIATPPHRVRRHSPSNSGAHFPKQTDLLGGGTGDKTHGLFDIRWEFRALGGGESMASTETMCFSEDGPSSTV